MGLFAGAMDAPHLLGALAYFDIRRVLAAALELRWPSARAHAPGEDDTLADRA